jgi:hypothetical protein
VKLTDILTEQALTLLAERLATPLQIEHYLTLAMEQAYRFGEKLVTPEIIETVMASDLNALMPTLTRHGYNGSSSKQNDKIRPNQLIDGLFS